MRIYRPPGVRGLVIPEDRVFVFGSNLAGIHGAGAARHAEEYYGAIAGGGVGYAGSSYAIPTKDRKIRTLPLPAILDHVEDFIAFARRLPQRKFHVSPIGCGLAGYDHADIAPLFRFAPENCELPGEWWYWIEYLPAMVRA